METLTLDERAAFARYFTNLDGLVSVVLMNTRRIWRQLELVGPSLASS